MNDLLLLAINLTERCNLACNHCYLDANTLNSENSNALSTSEVNTLLDEVALCGEGTMVVLTGGEPLLRKDLERIIKHGSSLGLAMVVGTNGTLLTRGRINRLKEAGVLGVGISIDSLDPARHDRFRGVDGAWEKTMHSIEYCRQAKLSFQIHFSITQNNVEELADMVSFSNSCGARVLNFFFLVCTGRGESMSDISPARYEEALKEIITLQQTNPSLIIRPRCAPHFKRVAWQQNPDSLLNQISGQEGDGCIAGTHYCRVTHDGQVTPCPYIDQSAGSIRERSFQELWNRAPAFEALRAPKLGGKCGECEYRQLCGGCRARAISTGGDLMSADPWCGYSPEGKEMITPIESLADKVKWTREAEQRVARAPTFIRRMIRQRAETYAAECGDRSVTTDHLDTLVARRFGKNRFREHSS